MDRNSSCSLWSVLLLCLLINYYSVFFSSGITGFCMAFARNFASLLVCRFFLGVFEAGLFPGLIYYTSLWYPKKQQAIRFGIFWSFSALAGAFGGAFAYGITQVQSSKFADWQLLFVVSFSLIVFSFLSYDDQSLSCRSKEHRRSVWPLFLSSFYLIHLKRLDF